MSSQYRARPGQHSPKEPIELVPVARLPSSVHSVFPFEHFNPVQSKCFATIFDAADNFVLSSPTGSGKTVVLELAICRLIDECPDRDFKVIYQAPIKALCTERFHDWQSKFSPLGLKVAELTGDSEKSALKDVHSANIIITTPEKWDSTTRRWRDHRGFMEQVRLLLIDEVHVLREDRGANLEAVVSRMKSLGTNIRFVVLSATIPNYDDIAAWLGKNITFQRFPAKYEAFDESYRPVKLTKHVYGYTCNSTNEHHFDQVCSTNLKSVIYQHTIGRPVLVFCTTRKIAQSTAQELAIWWQDTLPKEQCWHKPAVLLTADDKALQETLRSGVAFHHAGLSMKDRQLIQQAYNEGIISVICCTSTLAMGVNMPAHFVIVKNTVVWQQDAGYRDLSDLELMQMLGRAGRPQYDRSAVAVIMTRAENVGRFERMVTGVEVVESRLHMNMIEHINSEICLGTITDLSEAATWLQSTFFWIRLNKNPKHYHIDGDDPNQPLRERAGRICGIALDQLHEYDLIKVDGNTIRCTARGEAMARFFTQFETMKIFSSTGPEARMSALLSAIAQAAEFKSIRLRADQKGFYKELNKSPLMKWQIPIELTETGHKVSLIVQATLGGIDIEHDPRFKGQVKQFSLDRALVFQHASRLASCVVECELSGDDSVSCRNALELARSIGAKCWDDSPLQLEQLPGIGPVSVRKLIHANIGTIDNLSNAATHKIEMILSRNPPFGREVVQKASNFPKLFVKLATVGMPRKCRDRPGVELDMVAKVGFLNDKVPTEFAGKDVYVWFLAETSNGKVSHHQRASAAKIGKGNNVCFQAHLTSTLQIVTCYVSCENLAGTLQSDSVNPKIDPHLLKADTISATKGGQPIPHEADDNRESTIESTTRAALQDYLLSDELDDGDMFKALPTSDFPDIDSVQASSHTSIKKQQAQHLSDEGRHPRRLPNGRWECNHSCKDKDACRHLCCNEGLEKKPPKPRAHKKVTEVKPALEASETPLQSKSALKTLSPNSTPVVKTGMPSKLSDSQVAGHPLSPSGSTSSPSLLRSLARSVPPAFGSMQTGAPGKVMHELDLTSDDWVESIRVGDPVTPPPERPAKRVCHEQSVSRPVQTPSPQPPGNPIFPREDDGQGRSNRLFGDVVDETVFQFDDHQATVFGTDGAEVYSFVTDSWENPTDASAGSAFWEGSAHSGLGSLTRMVDADSFLENGGNHDAESDVELGDWAELEFGDIFELEG